MKIFTALFSLVSICILTSDALAQVNAGAQFGNENQNINRNQFDGGQVDIETEFLEDERRTSINDANQGGRNQLGGAAGFQQLFQGLANQQQGNNQGQNQTSKSRIVRAPLRIGFSTPSRLGGQRVPSVVQQSQVVLSNLPRFRTSNLQISKDGNGYKLTGSVNTQSEKDVAALVAKLQPGVSQVDNQIIVNGN